MEAVRDAIGPGLRHLRRDARPVRPARGDPARASCSSRSQPAWIEEPVPPDNLKALAKVAAADALSRSRPANASTTRSSSGSCSSCRQPTSFSPTWPLRRNSRDPQAGGARPRPTTCSSRRTTSPAQCLTAANLHLAACTPNFKIQEYFNDFADAHVSRPRSGSPPVVDGCSRCRPRPGSASSSTSLRRRTPDDRSPFRPPRH